MAGRLFAALLPALGQIAVLLANLAAIGLLARILSKADFGIYAYSLVLVTVPALVLEAGLSVVALRHHPLSRERAGGMLALFLLGALVVPVLALPPLIWLDAVVGPLAFLLVIYAAVALRALTAVPQSVLRRQGRINRVVVVDTLAGIVGLGAAPIALGLAGYGIWSLAIGLVLQAFIRAAGMAAGWPSVSIGRSALTEIRGVMRLGTGAGIASAMNYAAQNVSSVVLMPLLGPAALGVYSRGYSIAAIPTRLYDAVHQMFLFPGMAAAGEDRAALAEATARACIAALSVGTIMAAAGIWAAPELVAILLGPSWGEAVPVLQVLLIALPARLLLRSAEGASLMLNQVLGPSLRYGTLAIVTAAALAVVADHGLTAVAIAVSALTWAVTLLSLGAVVNAGVLSVRLCAPAIMASLLLLLTSHYAANLLGTADAGLAGAVTYGLVKGLAGATIAAIGLWAGITASGRRVIRAWLA